MVSVGLISIDSLSTNVNPDKSKLDKLRTLSTLSDAHITTFQYKPLIGVTQITDPSGVTAYYEYDSLGRLIHVMDMNHSTVEEYDYHYRNQ